MMIKEIQVSDLEASKSEVLIQKMTISYTNLKIIDSLTKMSQFTGGILGKLINYNNNDEQIAEIQSYSKKLSEQKKKK